MLKHGFDSKHVAINPDCRMLSISSLSTDDLVAAERYLHGDACNAIGREFDYFHAHAVVKVVYSAGEQKFPSLWTLARKYMESEECRTLDRLSKLPSANAA